MGFDDLTPAEKYLIGLLRDDMQKGFEQIHKRLDGMVTAQVLELTRQGFDHRMSEAEKDITDLAAKRETDAAERATDRRWRVGLLIMAGIAIVMPIVSIVVDLSRAAS